MSVRESGFGAHGPVGGGPEVVRMDPTHVDVEVGRVETTTAAGVDATVRAAAVAGAQWAATPLSERVERLRAGADAVAASGDALGPLLAAELGKPVADSAGEMGFAAAFVRHVCDRVAEVAADRVVDDDAGRVVLTRVPYGVIGAIVPWNAPLILSSLKVAPALATGNAIVVKPSTIAPFAVTRALATLAEHLPPGVLSVVHGEAEVGAALVAHPAVRKVAFTGGADAAHHVLAGCATQLTPAALELGGNDPAVLLDDLTLTDDVAERLVFGAFLTTGQVCMAAKRFYVPRARLEQFVDAFEAAARRVLVCGDPLDPEVTVGPLATAAQRDKVAALVADAAGRGAAVVELGRTTGAFDPEQGWFLRPSLVVDPPPDAPVVVQEQFGPTVPVLAYDDLDAAVAAANDTELGLASSVWSDDEDRAFAVGRRLEAGMTFVNCHNRAGMSLRVPFGGVKRSGFGREFGDEGIAEYLQTHALHLPGPVRDAAAAARSGDAAGAVVAANRYPGG